MNPRELYGARLSERRRHNRRSTQGNVQLTVDTEQVDGHVENISRSGVLFFSDGDLRVTVRVDMEGESTLRTGRLVRAQRMRGDSFGWAVEFDP